MHAAARSAVHLIHAGFTPAECRARVTIVRTFLTLVVIVSTILCGCVRSSHYELRGQVLAVDRDRQEVTIKHGDIQGFMPGMTMPFKVSNPKMLNGVEPGDLVTATLVVKDATGYLSSLERTGHEALAAPAPTFAHILEPGQKVPDVKLIDETGAARALSDWRGKVVAVTFIYTRCPYPDFCPKMDRQFKSVQAEILKDAQLRDRAALLSISFDPAFDTPTILAGRAKEIGTDPRIWHYATGEPEAINAFASQLGVSVVREGTSAESVTHNLRTAVIGSDGTLRTVFTGNDWTVPELTDALRHAS
jgi:protein SCO1